MDKNENKDLKPYESPFTRKTQVELEEGICAVGSATGTSVATETNNKVDISEQGHGSWEGTGDDISAGWE